MKRCKSSRGFTLVELIVIIGLLAMLSTLAVTNFVGTMEASQRSARRAEAERLANALNAYNAAANSDVSTFPGDFRIVAVHTYTSAPGFLAGQSGNHWGGSNGRIRALNGPNIFAAPAAQREVLNDAAWYCSVAGCRVPRRVNLQHYVNVWTAFGGGRFESSGVMAADFTVTVECETLQIILRPSPNEPHISFHGASQRWIVNN